jgi:general secretion pathway protein L
MIDLHAWRGSLLLVSAVLLVNIAALNFDWWQMSREAKNLRAAMLQIYQARYPKESVIIDPIAQMQQKIGSAKQAAGLAIPQDFTALATSFGEAWASIAASEKPSIASLEYRDSSLFVVFKTKQSSEDEAWAQQLKGTLESYQLLLGDVSVVSDMTHWKVSRVP